MSNLPHGECQMCNGTYPKREMTKIYYGEAHVSVYNPRLICHICDDCLAKLAEFLEVNIL
jgi:hypothetical protein